MHVTVELKQVSVGTEINIAQEGIPDAIPAEACYLAAGIVAKSRPPRRAEINHSRKRAPQRAETKHSAASFGGARRRA